MVMSKSESLCFGRLWTKGHFVISDRRRWGRTIPRLVRQLAMRTQSENTTSPLKSDSFQLEIEGLCTTIYVESLG